MTVELDKPRRRIYVTPVLQSRAAMSREDAERIMQHRKAKLIPESVMSEARAVMAGANRWPI